MRDVSRATLRGRLVRNPREAGWQTSWMMYIDRDIASGWQTQQKHGRHREREWQTSRERMADIARENSRHRVREWQTSRESPGDALVSVWSLHGEPSAVSRHRRSWAAVATMFSFGCRALEGIHAWLSGRPERWGTPGYSGAPVEKQI